MNRTELLAIANAEHLDMPVLDGSGRLHRDAVVLQEDGPSWKVFLVDERHTPIATTVRSFDAESDALDHVLRKLRQLQKSRQSLAELRAGGPEEPRTPQRPQD